MMRITIAILVYLGSRAAWERASANAYAGATAMVSALFSLVGNVVLLCFVDTDVGASQDTDDGGIVLARVLVCVWLATTIWAAVKTVTWACDVMRYLRSNEAKWARNDIANQLDEAERRGWRSTTTTTTHFKDPTSKYRHLRQKN
jgi:hypothetical protein